MARNHRPTDRARRLAFDVLRAVHASDAYANLALADLLATRRLTGRDAAFATELASGSCRWEGTYDLIISQAAARPLQTLQPAVLDVLRLGVHQILAMRIPPHAAVAATVDLGATAVGPHVAGLVNAVLRKVAARNLEDWLDVVTTGLEPVEALAVRTAHPRWIVDAFAEVLPSGELEQALVADNANPTTTLAIRPGLAEPIELAQAGAKPGLWSPFAASWTGNPADLAAVREGRVGVQDEGSQLVVLALLRASAAPGWWLDLCAGPGGKTALLTGLARAEGSRVLANDVSPHRAGLVRSALRAYGSAAASVIVADGTQPAWRPGSCSRVLADVPCSGLGALRRRPESRWRRRPEDVSAMHPLQVALLRSALDSTTSGGVLAYATCSPHRHETTDVLNEVLTSRSDFEILDAQALLPDVPNACRGPYLQLWPHRHGCDAMFAAYLRKSSAADR